MPTVTECLNSLLEIYFRAGAQITAWYIGLVSLVSWSQFAAADTLASHAGWVEFTGYSGTRKAWTPGVASGGIMTNSVAIAFVMTAAGTIKGAFLCSVTSGASGTLANEELFTGGDQLVGIGDTLSITYTMTSQDA